MLTRIVFSLKNSILQNALARLLAGPDVQVVTCPDDEKSWQNVVQSCGDIIVMGSGQVLSPIESGLEILNGLPETPTTIIIHENNSTEEHAGLVMAGADVALYSGLSPDRIAAAIKTTMESRNLLFQQERLDRRELAKPRLSDFASASEKMQLFLNEVFLVAGSNTPLLLTGETGTGKEHLAKAIHTESPRSGGPFITINAAALPEQLLESELFGHAQGAFTGATRSRRGAFEMAHGGTIFLDEIGEMPFHLQAKLLRVLQDFEVKPVGAEKSILVDVRVITATNRDLEKEISRDRFRRDLFYRLSVITLAIPPLRERRKDIPTMARRFFSHYRKAIGRDLTYIDDAAMEALCLYDWPGNVRELMNVIERAVLICRGNILTLQDLPDALNKNKLGADMLLPGKNDVPLLWDEKTLPEVRQQIMEQVEYLYIQMALKKSNGRIGEAARRAGIHSRSLYNMMKRLGLRKEDFKQVT